MEGRQAVAGEEEVGSFEEVFVRLVQVGLDVGPVPFQDAVHVADISLVESVVRAELGTDHDLHLPRLALLHGVDKCGLELDSLARENALEHLDEGRLASIPPAAQPHEVLLGVLPLEEDFVGGPEEVAVACFVYSLHGVLYFARILARELVKCIFQSVRGFPGAEALLLVLVHLLQELEAVEDLVLLGRRDLLFHKLSGSDIVQKQPLHVLAPDAVEARVLQRGLLQFRKRAPVVIEHVIAIGVHGHDLRLTHEGFQVLLHGRLSNGAVVVNLCITQLRAQRAFVETPTLQSGALHQRQAAGVTGPEKASDLHFIVLPLEVSAYHSFQVLQAVLSCARQVDKKAVSVVHIVFVEVINDNYFCRSYK